MLAILKEWVRSRQRRLDVTILWPSLKANARNLDKARAAFFVHCAYDPAWSDYNAADLNDYVESLT